MEKCKDYEKMTKNSCGICQILSVFLMFLMALFVFNKSHICFVFGNESNVTILNNGDYRLDSDYLDLFSIPTSQMTFENNGGEVKGGELSRAFDGDNQTFFKSAIDNGNSTVDGVEYINFVNYIDIIFLQEVTIDRVVYGSETNTTRGYPIQLNIYYFQDNNWNLAGYFESAATTSLVMFGFDSVSTSKIRLEFKKVCTSHKYVATARELLVLYEENEQKLQTYQTYISMYDNYSQTKLKSQYNNIDDVNKVIDSFAQFENQDKFQEKVDRLRKIALNQLYYDENREFGTSDTSFNIINRWGDIASYCRNDLQMSSFGTNRQVLGITACPGEQITIYVDGETGDPLPTIKFSQHMGSWRSWLSGDYSLHLGKNILTVPSFDYSDYTTNVPLGGPIYLCNPYLPSNQSDNVKLYIEGGKFYPVLTKDVDESEFLYELQSFVSQLDDEDIDIIEIVADHMIGTVSAKSAFEAYKNYSPLQSLNNWNDYMDKLLEFGGVTQDSESDLFDERNLHINVNIRLVQPWANAAAFAASEHIGIYASWQGGVFTGSNLGWGMSHEIGHALDNKNRIVSECSNNMYSKYNEAVIEKVGTRGEFAKTLAGLAPDDTFDSESFFDTNRQNYLIWWYIECWHNGYFAGLENCYRGKYLALNNFLGESGMESQVSSLGKTEKQVFFSSIVTGIDMSYYFERWGYSMTGQTNDPIFRESSSSETFGEIMQRASALGYISTQKPKLWYQNNLAYFSQKTPIYTLSYTPTIKSVCKVDGGYSILINHQSNDSHLGYEIYEGDDENGYQVIGFTYTQTFLDERVYDSGYTPRYKVVAIDTSFNCSQISDSKSFVESADIVCKIGDDGYQSISQALASANSGDTIIILKSLGLTGVAIDKDIIITIEDGQDIVISRVVGGTLFDVGSGCTLTIRGSENNYIIIDGENILQDGSVLAVNGKVLMEKIKIINNYSTTNGAICIGSNSKNNEIKNCIISNNTAKNGTAIYLSSASASAIVDNCLFESNKASEYGVFTNIGTTTMSNCTFIRNTSLNGILSNIRGGVIYISNSLFDSNSASLGGAMYLDGLSQLDNCDIKNNLAVTGGGIYYTTATNRRNVAINNCSFENNTASDGKDIYMSQSQVMTLKNTSFKENNQIIVAGGKLYVSDSCDISGEITIAGGDLILSEGLFTNIDKCIFGVKAVAKSKLFDCENFVFDEEMLANIILNNSKFAKTLENNSVYASPSKVFITINIGDVSQVLEYDYGEKILLDFDFLEREYAKKYICNEQSYDYMQEITLYDDLILTGVLANKYKVKFVFKEREVENYYIPNTLISMPTDSEETFKLMGWQMGSHFYESGDCWSVKNDANFQGVYQKLFKVTFTCNDEVLGEKYFEYSKIINPNDYYTIDSLAFWQFGDIKISDVVRVDGDMSLQAITQKGNAKNIVLYSLLAILEIIIVVCIVIIIVKKSKNKK